MTEKHSWDAGVWARVDQVRFDFMTRYIMERINEQVSFFGKTALELGSGTGRLSYLALRQGARKVTLVDSSRKALTLSRELFKDEDPKRYEIIDADLNRYAPPERFDIVFSSGVVEHFAGEDRFRVVRKHVELAGQTCLIVHPSKTLYGAFAYRLPWSLKLYGFQRPFSDAEMNAYLERIDGVFGVSSVRFHFFYYVPLLHNTGWLNRALDRTPLGSRCGGLTLTRINARPG